MTVIRLLPFDGATPQTLIVCLHGVGSGAMSLRPLGQMLRIANPTSVVIIPDAPHPSDLGGAGRQWFSVRGITNTNRADRIDAALPWLDAFIITERHQLLLAAKQVAVCGFSQGAMMALALASRDNAPRAIASIAGRIAAPIPARTNTSTRIFLSHGDLDPVVPFACMGEAERSFRSAGYRVTQAPMRGLSHVIAPSQADAACTFFAKCLADATLESTA